MKGLLTFLLVIVVHIGYAQTTCTEFNFAGSPLGPLPTMGAQITAEYGSPQVEDVICTPGADPNSARMLCDDFSGMAGDGIRYTTNFGINPVPTFEAGKTYEYSFLKFVNAISGDYEIIEIRVKASNVPITSFDDCPAGDCEVIKTATITTAEGICDDSWYNMMYSPSQTYDNMVFSVRGNAINGELLYVNIDKICVGEVLECMANFNYTIDPCGILCTNNQSTGQGLSYAWTLNGPGGFSYSSNQANFCEPLPQNGSYTINLVIIDGTGCSDDFGESFIVDQIDFDPPVIDCWDDLTIAIDDDPGCGTDFTFPDIQVTDASATTMTCTIDGMPVSGGQSVTLLEGVHSVICIAIDECENVSDTCRFDITIECIPDDGCLEDFESYDLTFLMNSVGNWQTVNGQVAYFQDPTTGNGTKVLRGRDGSGDSFMSNLSDFPTDWTSAGCELCFDIRYMNNNPANPATGIYSIYIFENAPPNPTNLIPYHTSVNNWARFEVNTPIGNSWTQVCVPTTISSGSSLPSNTFGQWRSPNPNSWNSLIQNVSGAGFRLDFASGNSNVEELFVDNFCFQSCPPQADPCGYICCEGGPNMDVEGLPIGGLNMSNPSGWYQESGNPAIVNGGCDNSLQSLALGGSSFSFPGDVAGYRINGVAGPSTIFLKDTTYCITYCAKYDPSPGTTQAELTIMATDGSPLSGALCSGGCEVIQRINRSTDGLWHDYQFFYTPNADYTNIVFANGSPGTLDLPPTISIDQVCVSEAIPVYYDPIPPTIQCPANTLVIGNDGINGCIATYTMPAINATDNVGIDTMYCTANGTPIAQGQIINVSATSPVNIVCIAIDLCGNADTCTYTVTAFCEPVGSCPSECLNRFGINLSTGLNSFGAIIPSGLGVVDPEWRLINNPPLLGCTSPLLPATGSAYITNWVHPNTTAWVNQPGVGVVSPFNQGNGSSMGFGCNNPFNANGDRIPYVFERTFCLCENAGADLSLTFRGDDKLYLELWNVTTNMLVGSSNTYCYPNATETWNQSFVLQAGTYALRAYLSNVSSTTLGMSVKGGISLQNLSEPLFNDDMCCENTTIAVRKILDLDCSGDFNAGDQLGVGWTFNLSQGGTVIATDVTDINGEVFFSGLPVGTYEVSEVIQPGYVLSSPTTNQVTITTNLSGFQFVDFFNCPSPMVDCDSLMVMASEPTCFDSSIITGLPCITVFDPVCGCDGNTYSNACIAQEAGVTVVSMGECNGNNTPELPDGCCYDINLKNNWGTDIIRVEVEMLTPDWIFSNVNLTFPYTFGSCPVLNNSFCIYNPSGSINNGTSRAGRYCLTPTSNTAASTQQVAFHWVQLINGEEVRICADTLTFECPGMVMEDPCFDVVEANINCDPDDPYQYDLCFKVVNQSTFPIQYVTMEDLMPSTLRFLPGSTTSKIVFPLPNPLPPGTTSNTICIKLRSTIPLLTPDTLCLNLGAVNNTLDTCCHDAVALCLPIVPCCDPCGDRSFTYTKINTMEGECCYSVDVENLCEYQYFDKISFKINTPGVCFGSHTMNPAFSSQFTVSSPSPDELCVVSNSGYIPVGAFYQFLNFCLDKIDAPSKDMPSIIVNWYHTDPVTNMTTVACQDTMVTDCESPDENICLMVMDQQIECIADSNKYRYTFTITNKSNPRFTADKLHLFVKNDPANWIPIPTGNIIPLPSPLDSGQSVTLTTCLMGPSFPATFSDFIFSYRLQGVNPNDCCFESVCDTIPVPPCDTIADCCDITEAQFCSYFDGLVTPVATSMCEVCYDFTNVDTCDVIGVSIDGAPFDSPILGPVCYSDLSSGFHTFCFEIERMGQDGIICIEKDTCYELFIECPPVDTTCCDITEEQFCNYFDGVVGNYTQSDCEITWIINLDSCDALMVTYPDGTSATPNNGDTLTIDISSPGIDSMCFTIERWHPMNMLLPCYTKDTCIYFEMPCDTTGMAMCPSCPIGTMSGNDLIVNGDFTGGNLGFTSDYMVGGISLVAGEYDVRSSSFLGNPNWSAIDHTSGTVGGRILVADGPNPNQAVWRQTVSVTPGNVYNFCGWFDNLVTLNLANNGPPIVEVRVNGTIIAGPVTINNIPDNWVQVTGSWTAPVGVTSATIEIFNQQTIAFADLAIDDLSFTECIVMPEPQCCDDRMRFDSLIGLGWQVTVQDCEVSVIAPQFDTCHWFATAGPDWGDGGITFPVITPAVPGGPFTHTYASSGTYDICILVYEGDDVDSFCWDSLMCTTVTVDCCNEDPCDLTDLTVSPTSTSNDSCCYEVSYDNEYCELNYFKGFRIDMTGGSSISSINGLNGFVINQIDNQTAEVMHSSGFVPQGTGQAFTICGSNNGPITFTVSWLVPDGMGGCDAICSEDFTRDCANDDPRCVFILQDSINCETGEYCFRIKNNTYPGFVINSVDFIGLTPSGATLMPNPISVPSIAPGDTSAWICLQYSGVNTGDTVCFYVVGHNTDITMNQPPTWCCADTVEHCFVVPDCCNEDPCDLTDLTVSSTSTSNDSCCYEVSYDNEYCELNYFKGFRIDMTIGSSISSINGLNGFVINQIDNQTAEVMHSSGFVPQGVGPTFTVCGSNSGPITFTVSWLVPDGMGGCDAICSEDFIRDCANDDPRCVFILQDSVNCETGEYCFRIKNNTYPGFVINSVDFIGLTPSGATLMPNPVSIPSIAPGDTSDWICLQYSGVNTGDTVCFYVVGHNTDITMNQPPTWCCADTVEHCFVVPDCGMGGRDCCDITEDSLKSLIDLLVITTDSINCEVCVDVVTDSCTYMSLLFGNGFFTFGPNTNEQFCYGFSAGINTGNIIIDMGRLDENGDTCVSTFKTRPYDFECGPEDCCDDVTQEDFDEFFMSFVGEFLEFDTCGFCIEVDFDDCSAALVLTYGDGTQDSITMSGEYCHEYDGPGPWNLGVELILFDVNGDICIQGDSTYVIELPDCPMTGGGDPCCDNVTANDLIQIIEMAFNDAAFTDCSICLPVLADSCDRVEINWGDGQISQFIGDSTICHDYQIDSTYAISIQIYRLDTLGNICLDTTIISSITIDDCTGGIICNPSNINIYNAVSPNGDNLNEYLEILVPNECGQIDVSIYNRWGQLVWSKRDYQNEWRGQSSLDRDLPDGTYYLIMALPDARDEDGKPVKALNTFIDLRRDRR